MEKYELSISVGPEGAGFREFVVNLFGDPEEVTPLIMSINSGTARAKLLKVTEGREEVDVSKNRR